MKDQETIARFIHLRANGLSYDKISAELKVSKPTLIQWSRKYQFDIQNLRAIETEALAEKCFAGRQERWELVSRDLSRVEAELAKRDLADVPTSQLLDPGGQAPDGGQPRSWRNSFLRCHTAPSRRRILRRSPRLASMTPQSG
jgi:Homeodomain-like domain-containing protein